MFFVAKRLVGETNITIGLANFYPFGHIVKKKTNFSLSWQMFLFLRDVLSKQVIWEIATD